VRSVRNEAVTSDVRQVISDSKCPLHVPRIPANSELLIVLAHRDRMRGFIFYVSYLRVRSNVARNGGENSWSVGRAGSRKSTDAAEPYEIGRNLYQLWRTGSVQVLFGYSSIE
jgi:hypothetical protein